MPTDLRRVIPAAAVAWAAAAVLAIVLFRVFTFSEETPVLRLQFRV